MPSLGEMSAAQRRRAKPTGQRVREMHQLESFPPFPITDSHRKEKGLLGHTSDTVTLKVHEYDVFALRPLDIQSFNELYETICGLSVLCNEGKALTATTEGPLGGGMPMSPTSSSVGSAGGGGGEGASLQSARIEFQSAARCS